MSDESARFNRRLTEQTEDARRRDDDPTLGPMAMVAQTTSDGVHPYPTQADRYFQVQPQVITGPIGTDGLPGPETEGATAILSPIADPFPAFNLGSTVPPFGSYVVVSRVEHRWVFRFDGHA